MSDDIERLKLERAVRDRDIEQLDSWVRTQPGAKYGEGRWHVMKVSSQPAWEDDCGGGVRTDQALCSCEWFGPGRTGDCSYSEATEDGDRHIWTVSH
jgi:hypothetical protein